MSILNSNLRKAAVLIRSLDAESAAALLGQLTPVEATRVRDAVRELGPIDPEEQADLLAEFRRARPAASESARGGVELSLSRPKEKPEVYAASESLTDSSANKRFDFLQQAPTAVLVSHLSREQAQTIAVVLSHLAPAHAAEVLAALPEKLQGQTIERLTTLGDTDSESVAVLESELAEWAANRAKGRAHRGRTLDRISTILAAADTQTRNALLKRMNRRDTAPQETQRSSEARRENPPIRPLHRRAELPRSPGPTGQSPEFDHAPRTPLPPAPNLQPLPRIDFDHLIHLDDITLAAVLRDVNADALALALAGSGDELVDRICGQMPKRTAKAFRRELRRIGPTRLSDMEAAQRLVAHHAALHLARRRSTPVSMH